MEKRDSFIIVRCVEACSLLRDSGKVENNKTRGIPHVEYLSRADNLPKHLDTPRRKQTYTTQSRFLRSKPHRTNQSATALGPPIEQNKAIMDLYFIIIIFCLTALSDSPQCNCSQTAAYRSNYITFISIIAKVIIEMRAL